MGFAGRIAERPKKEVICVSKKSRCIPVYRRERQGCRPRDSLDRKASPSESETYQNPLPPRGRQPQTSTNVGAHRASFVYGGHYPQTLPRPRPYRIEQFRGTLTQFFQRIKRYRRVGTRYDKLALNFPAFVQLAGALDFRRN